LGAHEGIIVGDFVEDSESLAECSLGGRGVTPIATLFDRTLRGWHARGTVKNGSLYAALKHLVRGVVPASRINKARGLGARRDFATLKQQLESRPDEDMFWGPVHGDLHASNVRIRASDAILIDFLSSRDGPLLADLAALEVGLLVRVPANVRFSRAAWKRIVKLFFAQSAFTAAPIACDPTEKFAWLAYSLRLIRLHALPLQRANGQYAVVLAYHLLRSSIKDRTVKPAEEYRRTAAYWLADRLLSMAFQ
jgi:Ser/Thr protein kinase RdoA (MazF antagonist)